MVLPIATLGVPSSFQSNSKDNSPVMVGGVTWKDNLYISTYRQNMETGLEQCEVGSFWELELKDLTAATNATCHGVTVVVPTNNLITIGRIPNETLVENGFVLETLNGNVVTRQEIVGANPRVMTQDDQSNVYVASLVVGQAGTTTATMRVEKFSLPGLVREWSQEFSAHNGGGEAKLFLGGIMIASEGNLVVAGSVLGSGESFGGSVLQYGASHPGEDAFLVKLSSKGGNWMQAQRFTTSLNNHDMFHGICQDPTQPNIAFLVGCNVLPGGQKNVRLSKLYVGSLTLGWTQYLSPQHLDKTIPARAVAWDCAVFHDKLYVAGGVQDNAFFPRSNQYFGGDDIFVAQFSKSDGTTQWLHQIGSDQNDWLPNPGGGLALDATGRPVVCGTTQGSLYRAVEVTEESSSNNPVGSMLSKVRGFVSTGAIVTTPSQSDHSDIFCVSLDPQDGKHPESLSPNLMDLLGGKLDKSLLDDAMAASSSVDQEDQDHSQDMIMAIAIVSSFLVLCVCMFACKFYCSRLQQQHAIAKHNQRVMSVFEYLSPYNSSELDIQPSPAGGMHVAYLNGLAAGEKVGGKAPPQIAFSRTNHETMSSAMSGLQGFDNVLNRTNSSSSDSGSGSSSARFLLSSGQFDASETSPQRLQSSRLYDP